LIRTAHIKLLLKKISKQPKSNQVYFNLRSGHSNPTQRDLGKNSSSTSADVAEGSYSLGHGIYVCVHGPDEAHWHPYHNKSQSPAELSTARDHMPTAGDASTQGRTSLTKACVDHC